MLILARINSKGIKEKQLRPFTNCTALENGWSWNIPLWSRMGTGYVHCDKFVDKETALKEFKTHLTKTWGGDVESLEYRYIDMRCGIHERLFEKNVVAIGLSAGFIAAFIAGLFACKLMIKIVKNSQLKYFAYYCFVLGLLTLFITL